MAEPSLRCNGISILSRASDFLGALCSLGNADDNGDDICVPFAALALVMIFFDNKDKSEEHGLDENLGSYTWRSTDVGDR